MKQTLIHSLFILFLFFSFQTKATCTYSFGLISQTIHTTGQTGTLNSLFSCEEYTFDYTINFSSLQTTISDQITIHLPIGIEYVSSLSPNGTATYVSGSTDIVFNLSNWNVNTPLTISFIGRTPCMNQSQSATGTTNFTGVNSCSGPTNVSQSISCYSSNIYATLLQPSPLLKNIGDIGELVFDLKNSSGNGASIRDVEVHLQPEATIAFYQNNYYLSTSNAVPSGSSIYSYVLPSGANVQSIPSNQILSIGQSDWNDVLNQNTLSDGQNIYLHVPYRVVSCSNSNTGHYDFYTMCNSSACDSYNVTSNIRVPDAIPALSVSNYPFEDPGSFCAAASQQEMILGYHVVNSNPASVGLPVGYGKATSIDLFLTVDNEFGGIDDATFTISNGLASITIPGSLVTLVNSSFSLNSGHSNSLYKIQLSQLPVNSGNWNPLGNNSLADLDGDEFLDDVIEGGSFDVKVKFTYQTESCPFFTDQHADYNISTLEWNHFNQCGTFVPGSAFLGAYNPYGSARGVYRYKTAGGGASIDLPTDVLAGTDFVSKLCFSPFTEGYLFNGFDFNCPDGYHRVRYSIPPGYHLNTSLLVSSTGNPGWYDLPDIVATAPCGLATQLITPIVQEICSTNPNERIIEIRFGRINHNQNCSQSTEYTFQLPCIDLPMFINCSASDTLCLPATSNFGFDNFHFVFDYVCDESCSSCGAFIEKANATTFHHCLGLCDSYFGTNPDFTFTRSDLGFSNPNETTGDTIIDCNNPGTALANNTSPSIDRKTGYPGDQIAVHASGHFQGSPAVGFIPYTGANFGTMGLQIRYNAFPGGVAMENRVFDLEAFPGDGFQVNCVNMSGNNFFINASDLTFTSVVDNNIVHMNIGFPQSAKDLMNQTGYTYEFIADLHLRVRMSPVNAQGTFFHGPGDYNLTSLRAEFLGYVNNVKYGSCDDYGAKFRILQPTAGPYLGTNTVHPTTCAPYEMQITFQNAGAKQGIADDFPNEFRSYAEITGPVTVEIPEGYSVVSVELSQQKKLFSSTGINSFNNIAQPLLLSFPVDFTTSPMTGGTLLTLTGTGGNACWPEYDLDRVNQYQNIKVKLQADCDALNVDTVSVSMNYTLSAQQPNPAYQHEMSFQGSFPLKHVGPLLALNEPSTNISTLNGTGVFDFSLCTQPPVNSYGLYPGANMAWIAFENSSVNGLDLTTATLINTVTNQPVPFTVYSNGSTQSIIANVGVILANHCINLRLAAHVNTNGCVDNNSDPVADFINVFYGNSCSGQPLSSPVSACQQGTGVFEFNRFPSRLELLINNNSFPGPVEMCNGLLEYHFILNNAELGPVTNPKFWLDLPAGITFQNITFAYPAISPTTPSPLTAFDGSTYGPSGNLGGWDILSHLGLTNLPGSGNYPNNQLAVTVQLRSSCSYDLSSGITFSAQGINTCGTSQETESAFHIPQIENTTLISDLDIDWSFSTTDSSPGINCSNSGTVSITVQNNSNSDNITGLDITAQVPTGVFTINPGSGSLNNDEITWHIPSGGIPGGGSSTVTFEVSLANDSICQLNAPFSISIAMTEDVACSASGGSCQVELQSEPLVFDIDACCNFCDLQLTTSSEPTRCKGAFGSATVSATGTSGTLTYLWNNGQTTATATNLAAGNYGVIVTDASGCSDTAFVTIASINTPILITATADQSTICSGQSASITLGGSSSYIVLTGSTVLPVSGNPFSVSPTQTTTYTIQTSDQYGCFGSTSIAITVLPNATMDDPADLSVCAGTLVTIPSFTSSTSATDYSWNNSNTQIGLSASGNGTIPSFSATNSATTPISATIIVTPNSGSCSGIPQTFTITVNPVPVMNLLTEAVLCAGTVINPLPFTSTIPGTTFTAVISNPAIGYVDATGTSFTATNSGTTPISGVITVTPSAGGCNGLSQSLTLTVTPALTPTFSPFGPYCLGTGSHILPTTSSNGISGTWSPAAVNTNFPGTTNYTFTPTSEQCATSINTSISVLINTLPMFDEFGTYCQNAVPGSLPTVSNNGITGTWSPPVINTANIGTYYYVFTPNSGACVSSNTTTVVVTPTPTPLFAPFGPYCLGTGSHILPTTSSNGISGTWSPASVNTNFPGAANYTFTPTSGQCATTISTSISVLINTLPMFDEFGMYCQNAVPVSLPTVSNNGIAGTWSPPVINTANIGTYYYVFTPNSGVCVSSNTTAVIVTTGVTPVFPTFGPYCKSNSLVTLPTVSTNGITGTWSPAVINMSTTGNTTYTFTPAVGQCATTKTIVVTVNPLPNFLAVSTGATICSGQSTLLFTIPQPLTETGYSYSWSPSATLSSSSGSMVTATPSVTTTYTITGTKLGCQSTKTFTVVVIPPPTISGPTTICAGGSALLQATAPTSPTPIGYLWTSSGGAATIVGTSSSILVSSPGTYTVTVSYSTGCQTTSSITVNPADCPNKCNLKANFNSSGTLCTRLFTSTSTVGITNSPLPGSGYTYNWTVSNAATGTIINGSAGTGSNLSYTFPSAGLYTVCLKVYSLTVPSCQNEICKTVFISCKKFPFFLLTKSEGLLAAFELKSEAPDESEADLMDLHYYWDFGDGTNSSEAKPVHQFKQSGYYDICLKIASKDNPTVFRDSICRSIYLSGDRIEPKVIPFLSVNPNPVNGETTISLNGVNDQTVEIKLYAISGELIGTLFKEACCQESSLDLIWDAQNLPPGVYLIKALVNSETYIEKVIVGSR
jgi:hypothetical protein